MAAVMKNIMHHRQSSDPKRRSLSLSWRENEDEARGRSLMDQVQETKIDRPPTPQPKDAPPTRNSSHGRDTPETPTTSGDAASVFKPGHLSRAGSIYTLSRESFSHQITQLTSTQLPDPDALRCSVAAIPTAETAARTLKEAAEQIQAWIKKASDVLNGLDSGDDAEWAAAAGREGLQQVDQAIARFESLVDVYVAAVEELQLRDDAKPVPNKDLEEIADQVMIISEAWRKIKKNMKDTKRQVELAIDWEKFRDHDIGSIEIEINDCSRMVFEMEERRHQAPIEDLGVDNGKVDSMLRDLPRKSAPEATKALEILSEGLRSPSLETPTLPAETEDRSLLGLFARMQPLRTQLNFLQMRMTPYITKASVIFPTACRELEERREGLEEGWSRLEADANALHKELAEDRWNIFFRNARQQILTMMKSVKKSLDAVDEAVEANVNLRHAPATTRKIEQYEAKKQHYCPSIESVIAILEQGVKKRTTVNGEISRLQEDIRSRWRALQHEIKHLDSQLEEYTTDADLSQQQLRTSVSTILSTTETSQAPSTLLTPGTSPPSSGAVSRKSSRCEPPQDLNLNKVREGIQTPSTPATTPSVGKRFSSLPLPSRTLHMPRTSNSSSKALSSGYGQVTPSSPLATPPSRLAARAAASPAPRFSPAPDLSPVDDKPRWSYVKQSGDYDVSAYYRNLMSKGKHYSPHNTSPTTSTPTSARHSSAPYHHSPSTTPYSSPLATSISTPSSAATRQRPPSRLTPRASSRQAQTPAPTPPRPLLNRKQSDVTPASTRHTPTTTPASQQKRATTSMGSRTPASTGRTTGAAPVRSSPSQGQKAHTTAGQTPTGSTPARGQRSRRVSNVGGGTAATTIGPAAAGGQR